MDIRNTFKIKFTGQKLKVRILGMDETINRNCLASVITTPLDIDWYKEDIERVKQLHFFTTMSVGELANQHPERIYLEVLSPFFQGQGKTPEEYMKIPLNQLEMIK